MTLAQLRSFVTIADRGLGGTATAPRTHSSQSALSKQLTHLENGLGFRLFTRKGCWLENITPEGELVLEHARRVVAEVKLIRSFRRIQ